MDSLKLPCNYALSFFATVVAVVFTLGLFVVAGLALWLVPSVACVPAQPRCGPSPTPLVFGFPSPFVFWVFGDAPRGFPPAGFGCRQQVGFPMCGVPPTPAQLGPWWFSCCFCFSLSLPPLLLDWGARGLVGLVGGWGVYDFAGAPRVGWVGWRPPGGFVVGPPQARPPYVAVRRSFLAAGCPLTFLGTPPLYPPSPQLQENIQIIYLPGVRPSLSFLAKMAPLF